MTSLARLASVAAMERYLEQHRTQAREGRLLPDVPKKPMPVLRRATKKRK